MFSDFDSAPFCFFSPRIIYFAALFAFAFGEASEEEKAKLLDVIAL